MQAVMWVILGGTVALAALVDRYRASVPFVMLDNTFYSLPSVRVRLPRGWAIDPRVSSSRRVVTHEDSDAPDVEAPDSATGRTLTVEEKSVNEVVPPEQVLADRFTGPLQFGKPISVLGEMAAVATGPLWVDVADRRPVADGTTFYVCVVLPREQSAVVVRLDVHQPLSRRDSEVVRLVAESLVRGRPTDPLTP